MNLPNKSRKPASLTWLTTIAEPPAVQIESAAIPVRCRCECSCSITGITSARTRRQGVANGRGTPE